MFIPVCCFVFVFFFAFPPFFLQSSVTEVETLQRKQIQFEEALEAQVDQLDQVEKLAQNMIHQKHYDSDNIRAKSKALAAR